MFESGSLNFCTKLLTKAINPLATAAWYETYPLEHYSPVDVVAGPVLLMKSSMMR